MNAANDRPDRALAARRAHLPRLRHATGLESVLDLGRPAARQRAAAGRGHPRRDLPAAPHICPLLRAGPGRRVRPAGADLRRLPLPLLGQLVVGRARQGVRRRDGPTSSSSAATGGLVIEVASNDGYLLREFVALGVPVLGVEPAANVADIARSHGVRTITAFFGRETARAVARGARPPASRRRQQRDGARPRPRRLRRRPGPALRRRHRDHRREPVVRHAAERDAVRHDLPRALLATSRPMRSRASSPRTASSSSASTTSPPMAARTATRSCTPARAPLTPRWRPRSTAS